MAEETPDRDNPDAPFGHNDDGTPLAPYGFKANGQPRLSNRGPRPGGGSSGSTESRRNKPTPSTAKGKAQEERDQQRKAALLQLSDMFITTPLAAASSSAALAKRIGEKQTNALAGDAVIWSFFAPSLADAAIDYSEQKPRTLAWMDSIQEKAPLLMFASVGLQMTKAFIGNHTDPNPEVAKAGRRLARMNVAKMAQAINAEAEAMGIPTDDDLTASMHGASNAA
jgi:hypothetical protein